MFDVGFLQREIGDDDPGRVGDRGDGEVDLGAEDDEGEADGDDRRHRDLGQDVASRCRGSRRRGWRSRRRRRGRAASRRARCCASGPCSQAPARGRSAACARSSCERGHARSFTLHAASRRRSLLTVSLREFAHDLALLHDEDAVREGEHRLRLCRDHDHRKARVAQAADDLHDVVLRADVHAARRLAQDEHLRRKGQPFRERRPSAGCRRKASRAATSTRGGLICRRSTCSRAMRRSADGFSQRLEMRSRMAIDMFLKTGSRWNSMARRLSGTKATPALRAVAVLRMRIARPAILSEPLSGFSLPEQGAREGKLAAAHETVDAEHLAGMDLERDLAIGAPEGDPSASSTQGASLGPARRMCPGVALLEALVAGADHRLDEARLARARAAGAVSTLRPLRNTVTVSEMRRMSSRKCEMKTMLRPPSRMLPQHREEPLDLRRRQRRGRLVEDDDARAGEQDAGDLDELLQADRQVADAPLRVDVDAERRRAAPSPRAPSGASVRSRSGSSAACRERRSPRP